MSKEFNKQESGDTQSVKAASRHSTAKLENDFSNLVRTQRKKIIFRGSALRIPSDFSSQTRQEESGGEGVLRNGQVETNQSFWNSWS